MGHSNAWGVARRQRLRCLLGVCCSPQRLPGSLATSQQDARPMPSTRSGCPCRTTPIACVRHKLCLVDAALPCSYLQRRRDRQGASFTYEVIIVDDGSSDGTVRAASEFVRKHGFDAVRVLRLPQNRGKGYAGEERWLVAERAGQEVRTRPHTEPGSACCTQQASCMLMPLHGHQCFCSQIGHAVLPGAAPADDGRRWRHKGV